MIGIFSCIILTALFVNGIHIASQEGMLLEPLKIWIRKALTPMCKVEPRQIYKPIIGCVRCMSSIYGTIICLLFLPFHVELIYQIPVVIACSSTVATIIHSQYI